MTTFVLDYQLNLTTSIQYLIVTFLHLTSNLTDKTSFQASADIAYNAFTSAAYSKICYKIGNIAIINLSTIKTQVYANTVLFTLPEGFRPNKNETVRARFVYNTGEYANRGSRMRCYPLSIHTNGQVISDFNDRGAYWDIDVFAMFLTS